MTDEIMRRASASSDVRYQPARRNAAAFDTPYDHRELSFRVRCLHGSFLCAFVIFLVLGVLLSAVGYMSYEHMKHHKFYKVSGAVSLLFCVISLAGACIVVSDCCVSAPGVPTSNYTYEMMYPTYSITDSFSSDFGSFSVFPSTARSMSAEAVDNSAHCATCSCAPEKRVIVHRSCSTPMDCSKATRTTSNLGAATGSSRLADVSSNTQPTSDATTILQTLNEQSERCWL